MSKKTRRKFDPSFKRETVRMADQSGKPDLQLEKDLGLFQGAIRHWRKELEEDYLNAFPGTGHQTEIGRTAPCKNGTGRCTNGARHIKKSYSHLFKNTEDKYKFMKKNCTEFSIEKMAAVLNIHRSGYYDWLKRPTSNRRQNRMRFDVEVKALFEENKQIYGSEKISQELVKKGFGHNRKRVAHSMVSQGLKSKVHKKFRVTTTDSSHGFPIAANVLNRNFTSDMPNQKWVTDITYLPSQSGWLYLTVFIDLYSRLVVGWAISSSLSHVAVLTALQRGIWRRKPGEGLIIHSDRGVQFCCDAFRKALQTNGFVQSMSRKGNCWDNAVAESFFRTLKTELIYHTTLLDENHARHVLFDYIEGFYNCKRSHSTLGYLSPTEFEIVKNVKCA